MVDRIDFEKLLEWCHESSRQREPEYLAQIERHEKAIQREKRQIEKLEGIIRIIDADIRSKMDFFAKQGKKERDRYTRNIFDASDRVAKSENAVIQTKKNLEGCRELQRETNVCKIPGRRIFQIFYEKFSEDRENCFREMKRLEYVRNFLEERYRKVQETYVSIVKHVKDNKPNENEKAHYDRLIDLNEELLRIYLQAVTAYINEGSGRFQEIMIELKPKAEDIRDNFAKLRMQEDLSLGQDTFANDLLQDGIKIFNELETMAEKSGSIDESVMSADISEEKNEKVPDNLLRVYNEMITTERTYLDGFINFFKFFDHCVPPADKAGIPTEILQKIMFLKQLLADGEEFYSALSVKPISNETIAEAFASDKFRTHLANICHASADCEEISTYFEQEKKIDALYAKDVSVTLVRNNIQDLLDFYLKLNDVQKGDFPEDVRDKMRALQALHDTGNLEGYLNSIHDTQEYRTIVINEMSVRDFLKNIKLPEVKLPQPKTAGSTNLRGVFVTNTQRVPRYELLLREAIKISPALSLKTAGQLCSDFAIDLNEFERLNKRKEALVLEITNLVSRTSQENRRNALVNLLNHIKSIRNEDINEVHARLSDFIENNREINEFTLAGWFKRLGRADSGHTSTRRALERIQIEIFGSAMKVPKGKDDIPASAIKVPEDDNEIHSNAIMDEVREDGMIDLPWMTNLQTNITSVRVMHSDDEVQKIVSGLLGSDFSRVGNLLAQKTAPQTNSSRHDKCITAFAIPLLPSTAAASPSAGNKSETPSVEMVTVTKQKTCAVYMSKNMIEALLTNDAKELLYNTAQALITDYIRQQSMAGEALKTLVCRPTARAPAPLLAMMVAYADSLTPSIKFSIDSRDPVMARVLELQKEMHTYVQNQTVPALSIGGEHPTTRRP